MRSHAWIDVTLVIPLAAAGAMASACGDDLAGLQNGGGGAADAAPPPDEDADAGGEGEAPLLSHQPAWIAQGAESETCFGDSAAVADLDGDGRSDLLVGIPRCFEPVDDKIAVFRGEGDLLAAEDSAMRVAIDWQNENPFPINLQLSIATGDVDGDDRADVLVSSRDGAALYRGNEDLAATFAEPAFRVPGETFRGTFLADLNGDGRDDIAASVGGSMSIFLARQGDGEGEGGGAPVFEQTRTLAGGSAAPGDVDGDGLDDILVGAPDGTVQLYLGCDGELPACDGGLGSESVWSVEGSLSGRSADLDGDGRGDAVLGDFGRLSIYMTGNGDEVLPDAPTWMEQGDAVFVGFGNSPTATAGILGSGSRELLVGASARVYLYRLPGGPFDDLEPAWAFPEPDTLTAEWPIDLSYDVAAAGDLDSDGYEEFVVAGTSLAGGTVFVFTGGMLADDAPRPYLPDSLTCGPLTGGTADLTVDTDVLARTVHITTDPFEADACEVVEGCVNAPGDRRLLRFSVSIANLGAGDAVVPGPEQAPELYEFDECHGHDHLIGFSNYRLTAEDGAEVMGHKQGYYMVDIAPYCAESAGPADLFPAQGISAGWADVYIANYDCQWIDITGVPDGTYQLRVSVDDSDVIPEGDEHPNEVGITVEIAGDEVTATGRGAR